MHTSAMRGNQPKPNQKMRSLENQDFSPTEKSTRRDSNPRPRPWQGRAPPTEPLVHFTSVPDGQVILYITIQILSTGKFKNFSAQFSQTEFVWQIMLA